jgi:hypothetical protein
MIAPVPAIRDSRVTGVVVRETPISPFLPYRSYGPTQFQDDVDVAECALDEELEQLQRQYATACRAAARARIEIELFERRDDIPTHLVNQAKRQLAAAETRCERLHIALECLEGRLENQ